MHIKQITEIITTTVDNTFAGTLLAGLMIAYIGLRLYKQQKKVDIDASRKEKLHDLAVNLLTHINVALKDYVGQISVHDGTNIPAKMLLEKMESISPGYFSRDTSNRFSGYVRNITQAFNELSTPLALNSKNENRVKVLTETIPLITFLFTSTEVLKSSKVEDLKEYRKLSYEYLDKIRVPLEEIINN